MVTQPLMYKKIALHEGTRKLYADKLVAAGLIRAEDPEAMIATLSLGDGRRPAYQQDRPLQLQAAVRD